MIKTPWRSIILHRKVTASRSSALHYATRQGRTSGELVIADQAFLGIAIASDTRHDFDIRKDC